MELLYQTCQSGSLNFLVIPTVVLLQHHYHFRIYTLHMVLAFIETALINYAVQYKFCIQHQLMHEIKALYAMTHVEHHICKGIHPTTSAVGVWESWTSGIGIGFATLVGLGPIPFLSLQMIYVGANLVVHTMWPVPSLLQWHTLHHTVLADVYNVNIPSRHDREHSKAVAKLDEKLRQISPFVRYEFLSDLVALGFMVVLGAIFHYGFGVGVSRVDWYNRTEFEYY
jgi:hypothetical protein